jgi:hypothetical protein
MHHPTGPEEEHLDVAQNAGDPWLEGDQDVA